jgi:hypothetical protein
MRPVQVSGSRSIWVSECKSYIIPCLETHKPLDLVIIMLGTNDLKMRFSVSAYDIANGAGALVQIVQKSETGRGGSAPQVLLLAPPPVAKLTGFVERFEGAETQIAWERHTLPCRRRRRGFDRQQACVSAFVMSSGMIQDGSLPVASIHNRIRSSVNS